MTNVKVALYARVSSGPQELSLDAQARELREHADREGFEVVEEVRDLAQKRHVLSRPGLDRLRELAASGAIAEVWAVEFERYGEGDVPMLLAIELGAHGVRCRWPGDGGEGLGGEIMRAVAGVLSREEQRKRAERTRRGKLSKARRGQVLGSSPKARFGFSYVRDGRGEVVGYEVDEQEMAVVRRIFAMLDGGASINAVQVALEADGVAAPRGGAIWSRDTVKKIVGQDAYRPHTPEELAALVEEGLLDREVHAGLDPQGTYGIDYYGRTRSRYASARSKRRKVEPAPRSEWVAIPVSLAGSGLERAKVERARRSIEGNRASAQVGDHTWELSRGFLFCADCGRAMVSFARRWPEKGTAVYYYRCPNRHAARGNVPALCPNRKSHRAEVLEHDAASMFETYASRETMLELYDRAVAKQEERTGTRANLERRAALAQRISELELERRGYLRQNARGKLTDDDLDAMLDEVDEQREAVAAELRVAEDATAAADRLRAARDSLVGASGYNPVHSEWAEDPDSTQPGEFLTLGAKPEEIRAAYRRYGARFEVDCGGEIVLKLELQLDGPGSPLHSTTTPPHSFQTQHPVRLDLTATLGHAPEVEVALA